MDTANLHSIAAEYDRAVQLLQAGDMQSAELVCRQSLLHEPQHAESRLLLGVIELRTGRASEATDSIRRSMADGSPLPVAHSLLGDALLDQRRPEEALRHYDEALRLDPDLPPAHYGRGNALLDLGRAREAAASYESALTRGHLHPEVHFNLGNALYASDQLEAAAASYQAAIDLDPSHGAAYSNLGNALLELSRPDAALAAFDRGVALRPELANARQGRGMALLALNRMDDAAQSLQQALALNEHLDRAPGALLHARRCCADWSAEPSVANPEQIVRAVLSGRAADGPFSFLAVADDPAAQLACAKTYLSAMPAASSASAFPAARRARIRVAYVSGDFRTHAVAYLMTGIIEHHDPRRFDTLAISLRPAEDSDWGRRIRNAFGRFIDVSRSSDRDVAAQMRNLDVDIAVDLTGYTDGHRPRIFAQRSAPIQVNYLGFPGTSGAPYMDYIIADGFVIPARNEAHFSEHIARLPLCFQGDDDRIQVSGPAPERAALGLPQAGFVFCCFNNTYKLNPPMFDAWMRLLRRVPDSVLWIVDSFHCAAMRLRHEAHQRGVDPDRLVFAGRLPYERHLERMQAADLFLDTLPFNAGATARDALRAGLPLLTCAGESFAARMAGSLLHAAGLPELVTDSLMDYEARAAELASDRASLAALRLRLRRARQTAPAFDTQAFTRQLESAYEIMWRRHERGEAPASFAVPG